MLGYEPWASYIPSLLSNLQYEGNIGTSSYTHIHFFCTLRSVCINLCVHLKLERAICIPQSGLASMGRRNRPSARGFPCQSVGCPYIAEESRSYCCNRCKEGNNRHSRNCTATRTDPGDERPCPCDGRKHAASKPTPKSMPKTNKQALEKKAKYLKQRLQASALSARARQKPITFLPFPRRCWARMRTSMLELDDVSCHWDA